nr:hypothetical protein [Tanacetum cinerariifolium]
MILESVEIGPFIWHTIEENGVTKTKKYVELSTAKKIQVDCDMKATNIILHDLPADIYSVVNHHRVAKDLWERVQLLMEGFDLISCFNKAMAFLTAVASSRTKFENAFNLEFKERMQKYTRFDAQSFKDAMIFNMDSIRKYMLEIILHQQWTPHLLKQKKLMQTQEDHSNPIPSLNVDSLKTQESTIDTGKAVDAGLVFIKRSGTESEVQDNNNRSGNDTDADDAYIRPIYDEEPMDEVQLTAKCNIFAIR